MRLCELKEKRKLSMRRTAADWALWKTWTLTVRRAVSWH